MFMRILKEPLLHFLALGLGLFIAYGYIAGDGDESNPKKIVVDRDKLLTFMQYRAKTFDTERFSDLLDKMPEDKLNKMIDDYVQEEAMYREAKALSLDKNDYVARRRLIQQLEYINRGFISSEIRVSDEELQDWLDSNKEKYYVPAKVTFTHVFFNGEKRGDEAAQKAAEAKVNELNANDVPFHESLQHGDRFFYHVNYVEKEADEIASHFGQTMQEAVFALEADDTKWHGPYPSQYGYHVVMVAKQLAGYNPPLDEVKGRVAQDLVQARLEEELGKATKAIVESYDVKVASDVKMKTGEAS